MEHWEDAEKDADESTPDTEFAKMVIEFSWGEVGGNYWKEECGDMPENPVEYYRNGDKWDRELQNYENCLSCLCDDDTWDQEGKHCNM